ncbi:hypothetical protein HIM_06046 [Hirsutella minnesotensis 3608]|uniref:Uncharacterized protein n=1 Tax=Hirsutella minnesotensis 3608 TaxID=1043627 RepID=A0A0F7ZNW3_9HYPO|nr:hypothetical protein HIM_06046 [Hirsutella minnesotensis 3608]
MKRSDLTHEYFSRRGAMPPSMADKHRAFNLVVQVMAMVKCSAGNQPSGVLELGTQPLTWHSDKSLTEFMLDAFPHFGIVNLNVHDDLNKTRGVKPVLTGARLKKVAGLRFRGTDDLRNHLRMDDRRGIIEIDHYTSVLKEHLVASRPIGDDAATLEQSISRGIVPRQIALEALDSVQKILFPFDSDSEVFLRGLVSKQSFDPDCLRYDSAGYRMQAEQEIRYKYFGRRLLDLLEEVENPSPRGTLEKWLQRKSGARYVMMATLVGVFCVVVLGILGLAVGIFQAWVAYEAWKYPPTPQGRA